jgi:hypothetical protein
MKSLEMKPEPSLEVSIPSSFPSFYVCDEQMPEIAGWEPDGEYTLKVKVRVKTKSQVANLDGVDVDSCLEVLSYDISE